MANWTPRYSTLLSQMLDGKIGSKEMINTRQDYCKILDCAHSTASQRNSYFTGSRAEGLHLQGSDEDYMIEINSYTKYNIKVIQSLAENTTIFPYSTFLMSTENVRPGFTLLQHVPQTPLPPFLNQTSRDINGLRYLSSDIFIQKRLIEMQRDKYFIDVIKLRRQGPSMEMSTGIRNMEPMDNVDCIRCTFWPNEASEWQGRPRHFGWPTEDDILSITDFGFHLVPIGHPHSDTSEMEWRISFSIAERTLVWSFNHIQMQCYALMKIILKQFINLRCSQQNQVLCSYFIKTFLFWKYETTDGNFWREDNLRECINYLLAEFSKCIRKGSLRHYFIPQFNLLSVKLTPTAQHELLQLFDFIIESDIRILKDCEYLQNLTSLYFQLIVWGNEAIEYVTRDRNKISNLNNDTCMRENFESLKNSISPCLLPVSGKRVLCRILSLFCKTPLHDLVLKYSLLNMHINSATDSWSLRNKSVYRLKQTAKFEMCSFDISTCKIWCATLLYMTGDYRKTLAIINQFLSSIPPYAMHHHVSNEAEQMYADACGSKLGFDNHSKSLESLGASDDLFKGCIISFTSSYQDWTIF